MQSQGDDPDARSPRSCRMCTVHHCPSPPFDTLLLCLVRTPLNGTTCTRKQRLRSPSYISQRSTRASFFQEPSMHEHDSDATSPPSCSPLSPAPPSSPPVRLIGRLVTTRAAVSDPTRITLRPRHHLTHTQTPPPPFPPSPSAPSTSPSRDTRTRRYMAYDMSSSPSAARSCVLRSLVPPSSFVVFYHPLRAYDRRNTACAGTV
jgi:hypothetical protein